MRKLLSLILSIAMILSMSVVFMTATVSADWDGTAATGIAEGAGTEANPWIIKTAAELKWLADQVNAGAYAVDTDSDGVADAPTALYVELGADL